MYSSSSEKNLKSIKSRMGWQVALQAGTLLSIGSLNSTVKKQTDLITSELTQIQDINIDGFASIEDALNSLESSLIAGFEDLKWFLGSIDDKLAKLIGLVEFPKSTESTEQYLFGLELFKQEYYKKSINTIEEKLGSDVIYHLFSDDIEFLEGIFKGKHVVVHNDKAVEDWVALYLMKNVIQTNSSFCWTASLYNKNISIQPEDGYNYHQGTGAIPYGFHHKNSILIRTSE